MQWLIDCIIYNLLAFLIKLISHDYRESQFFTSVYYCFVNFFFNSFVFSLQTLSQVIDSIPNYATQLKINVDVHARRGGDSML